MSTLLTAPVPKTSGGIDHGSSSLRFGTSWVQSLDASGNSTILGTLGVGVAAASAGAKLQAGDGTTGAAALYMRAFGSATGADIYIGQSGGAIFGFSSGTAGFVLQNAAAPFGIATLQAQPIYIGTGSSAAASVRIGIGAAGDVAIGKGTTAAQSKLELAGGTFAVTDSGLSWVSTKFDSQGVARNTLTSPSIVLNGASTDRPEIAWYRGARTYPELAIRESTTADSGGEIWVGGGTVAPFKTIGINSSLVGIYSPGLQLGAGDNTSAPGSVAVRGANVSAGTTDGAGANVTITAGLSTGAGAGGSVVIQSGTTGTTGTALNAAAARGVFGPNGVVLGGATTTIGSGDVSAAPQAGVLKAPSGSGTDIAGASLTLRGGLNTGAGLGGSLIFQTSPAGTTGTTLGTATTRLTIDSTGTSTFSGAVAGNTSIWNIGSGQIYKATDGKVGIGNTAPAVNLHVGDGTAGTGVCYFRVQGSSTGGDLYMGQTSGSVWGYAAGAIGLVFQNAAAPLGIGTFSASQPIHFGIGGIGLGNIALTISATKDLIVNGGDLGAPPSGVVRASDTAGTDIASPSLTIRTGRGTGAGAAGNLIFQTSTQGTTGTTLQTATTRLTISSTTIASTLPVVPSTNGGTTSGSSTLRWSTTFTQALDATGNVLTSGATSGVGYAAGAGGTVTQLTSKATGVTLSKPTGQITTAADALAAGALVSFTLTNTLLAATDNITVQRQSGGTAGAYRVWVDSVAAGSCVVCIENRSAGSLSEALVLNMNLHKGANA